MVSVQVENETGVMGAAREHSDEANVRFAAPVPQAFVDHMRMAGGEVGAAMEGGSSSGTWTEVFGPLAEEVFSAYHIARYVNAVAEAGKREYPIPLTVNCWLDKEEEAGTYPSGGPVAKMMEVWRYCAPSVDIIGPDIYVPNFPEVCARYARGDNPLYIPECAVHGYAGARAVLGVGRYHAACYSPFGFEDMGRPLTGSQLALFGGDASDSALQTPQDVVAYGEINRILGGMMTRLTQRYGTAGLQASSAEIEPCASFGMGRYRIDARFTGRDGVCLVLQESADSFFLVVQAAALSFHSADPALPGLDILRLEEGRFADGVWYPGRRLNGDEAVLNTYDGPTALFAKLFAYR